MIKDSSHDHPHDEGSGGASMNEPFDLAAGSPWPRGCHKQVWPCPLYHAGGCQFGCAGTYPRVGGIQPNAARINITVKPFDPAVDQPQACCVCPDCGQIFGGSSYQTHGNEAHGWDVKQKIVDAALPFLRKIATDHPNLDVAKLLEEAIKRDIMAKQDNEKRHRFVGKLYWEPE
jgi:hypothetical protein